MRSDGAPPPDEAPEHGGPGGDPEKLGERDQTLSDSDQTLGDREQQASDDDQQAADEDQAAADSDDGPGVESASHAHTTAVRAETTRERLAVGQLREDTASQRDQAARERDELAAQRDRDADMADERALDLDEGAEVGVQGLRTREVGVRERAAAERERAARDRRQAARDRELNARDREEARRDRERAGTDELTGARRRGVGLEELEREIARARRTGENLVVAYVDVDGLKRVNDEHGHSTGDELLRQMAERLKHHMRTYDLLIRLGGDEFLCVFSGVGVDEVRRRLHDVGSESPAEPAVGSVTIGLGELLDGEGAQELIDRADRDLLSVRSR